MKMDHDISGNAGDSGASVMKAKDTRKWRGGQKGAYLCL